MNNDIRKLLQEAASSTESVDILGRCGARLTKLSTLGATQELVAAKLVEAFGHDEAVVYLREVGELCTDALTALQRIVQIDKAQAAATAAPRSPEQKTGDDNTNEEA